MAQDSRMTSHTTGVAELPVTAYFPQTSISTGCLEIAPSTADSLNHSSNKLGQRICLDGYFGTICYHGPVPRVVSTTVPIPATKVTSPKIWFGIEWDDPSRGKHCGDHEGISYFTTHLPNAGSFVAESKLIKGPFGRCFLEGMVEKYIRPDCDSGAVEVPFPPVDDPTITGSNRERQATILLGGNSCIQVRTYGFEKVRRKQSNLSSLKEVGLQEMRISHCGPTTLPGLGDEVPPSLHIWDLDLSYNWFRDFQEIAFICQRLPLLKSLRASHMQYAPFAWNYPALQASFQGAFVKLTNLSLHKTKLPWDDLLILLDAMPVLEELHFGANELSTIGLQPHHLPRFQHVTMLNFESNLLTWDQVALFSTLPVLHTLVLENNHVSVIPPNITGFPALAFLNINYNQVADWASIHHLNAIPSLRHVRLKCNIVLDSIPVRNVFAELIARLRTVEVLNGSTLLKRDRLDSELFYISTYAPAKKTMESAAFEALHPNYAWLASKYDIVTPTPGAEGADDVDLDGPGKALKERLIPITFHLVPGAEVTPPPLVKKLPRNMSIRSLRMVLTKCFRLRGTFQLVLVVTRPVTHDMEVDNDGRQYSVEQEDELVELSDDTHDLAYYGLRPPAASDSPSPVIRILRR